MDGGMGEKEVRWGKGRESTGETQRAEVSAAVRALGRAVLLHVASLRGQTLRWEQ